METIIGWIIALFGGAAAAKATGGGAVAGATMGGIPLELLTMLASGVFSAVMSLWSQSIKAKAAAHEQMIDGLKVRASITDTAREFGRKNPKFEFTRRCIALMATFSIIVLPKIAAVLFPHVPITVGYTEFHPGFLFLTEGHDTITWRTVTGFALTPLDTHVMAAIIGLYFGASTVRNA